MSAHTPGPWEAVLSNDKRGQPVCYYRGLIALVESRLSVVLGPGHAYDTVPEEQWEPNAKLIAASPRLAAALAGFRGLHPKCIISSTGRDFRCPVCSAADAALAAAGAP